jgi:heat shock protein HslJ
MAIRKGAGLVGPTGTMEIGPLATTRMAGPADAMQAENAYLALLDTVKGYSVSEAELDLLAGDNVVLTYRNP